MSKSTSVQVDVGAASAGDSACSFGQAFASAARALLGADLQVFLPGATQEPADSFVQSCEGACYVLHAGEDSEAAAWCDIETPLALAMACRLLGCEKSALLQQRPLTEVERRVAARAAEAAAQAADNLRAWRASPAAVGSGAPPDVLTVLRLGVSLGRSSGVLRLGMRKMSHAGGGPAAAASAGPIELRVTTEDFNVSDETLAGLSVGDVLATDLASDGEVIVRVAGVPKFAGRLGQYKGRRAVVITRKLF
ncbi:MAG: FliM/FliN family flagellar motor C-terminal domain-containing protein [Planctomycetaceae bacterium]|nr:FliM/FliN family flagellar motor C-terminal domain-containing protein [Planctomycetaceae bacterium]